MLFAQHTYISALGLHGSHQLLLWLPPVIKDSSNSLPELSLHQHNILYTDSLAVPHTPIGAGYINVHLTQFFFLKNLQYKRKTLKRFLQCIRKDIFYKLGNLNIEKKSFKML